MSLKWNEAKNYTYTDSHVYFFGGIFSQWYPSKFKDKMNNVKFNCAEQFMMWSKALTFNDLESAEKILKSKDPKEQKALGRIVKGYKDDVWANKRFQIVELGSYLKFSQNEGLKKDLLETGDKVLVEGSPYDCIWGVGIDHGSDLILDEKNWKGQNLLGKALMGARDLLRKKI